MRLLACLCVLILPAHAADWQHLDSPAGPGSMAPTLVALEDGRAVVSWLEAVDGGHAFRFSLFDGDSFGPATEIARGADWFANWADTPAMHVLPNGDWLAHWLVKSGPATYAYDIVMARSVDSGETWSASFSPHDDATATEHGFVSYFDWDDATAGLAWLDGRETGAGAGSLSADHAHGHGHDHGGEGAMTLRTASVNEQGQLAREALLDERVCDCCQTASAMTSKGPVVVYRGRDDDEVRDIRIVRYREGQWSWPEVVHADGWQIAGCPVNGPALIARDQNLVAAWFTMVEDVPKVRVAVSTDAGKSFSAPVGLGQGEAIGRVDLAWLDEGFVVSWMKAIEGRAVLVLSFFSSTLEPMSEVSPVLLSAARVSGFPRMIRLGSDRLMLAWSGTGQEGRPQVQLALQALPADDPN